MGFDIKPAQGRRRTAGTAASQRQNNRRHKVLAAAAKLFAAKGLSGTSMRDIASATGMLPGSLYYYFPSKDELFLQVHADAVADIDARVVEALEGVSDPWERLEAAAGAHLEGLLRRDGTVAIVQPHFDDQDPELAQRLRVQRDGYEARFGELVAALPLAQEEDRRLLRLLLLGGLNWATLWVKEGPDRQSPAEIGRAFVGLIRRQVGV
ncbi:MAG: TetR/AcrR family transcriptional regulator [Pseudomonadota bacterium]